MSSPQTDRACRDVLRKALSSKNAAPAHPGLLMDRYLVTHARSSGQGGAGDADRVKVLRHAIDSIKEIESLHRQAFARYQSHLADAITWTMKTTSPLVIGLGAQNPLEVGLTFHHSFGVPIIPGTAIKGLLAHYSEEVLGLDGPTRETLFGTTGSSGMFVFYDAWIVPSSLSGCLRQDVITVHHPDYYAQRPVDGAPVNSDFAPPSDFDDPNPVAFLHTVGEFAFAIEPVFESEHRSDWCQYVKHALVRALYDWGIGAKTRSGYGRLAEFGEGKDVGTAAQTPRPQELHVGDRVRVRKIDDPKGKNRPNWFALVNGDGQGVLTDEGPPNLENGDEIDVYIQNHGNNYNFQFKPPSSPTKSRARKSKR